MQVPHPIKRADNGLLIYLNCKKTKTNGKNIWGESKPGASLEEVHHDESQITTNDPDLQGKSHHSI